MREPDYLSRRSLLAGIGAALPAAALAAPLAAEADADLLALGPAWEAAAASDEASRMADHLSDEDAALIYGRETRLQVRIVRLPARALEGLRLKARVALRAILMEQGRQQTQDTLVEDLMESDGVAGRLPAAAVVLDLLALGDA